MFKDFLILGIYVNTILPAVRLAVSQLKLRKIINVKHYQGVSNVDDKNEDKTVKSTCDPEDASRKWTRTRKLNTK